MKNTVVVEVTEHKPHPLYRKLLKKSKRFKADPKGQTLIVGDIVRITGTRPLAGNKHFAVTEVLPKRQLVKEEENNDTTA